LDRKAQHGGDVAGTIDTATQDQQGKVAATGAVEATATIATATLPSVNPNLQPFILTDSDGESIKQQTAGAAAAAASEEDHDGNSSSKGSAGYSSSSSIASPPPPVSIATNPNPLAAVVGYMGKQAPFNYPLASIPLKQRLQADLSLDSPLFSELTHIADGSNAHVFLARLQSQSQSQPGLAQGGQGQQVIVKLLKEGAGTVAIQEFELELAVLTRLQHPNIVRVLAAGRRPRPFLVLEHLSGGTLSSVLQQQQAAKQSLAGLFRKPSFTYSNLLALATSLADALDYLHRRCHGGATFVHRDLKPDNIGFTRDGSLKLFDFGLVTVVKSRKSSDEAYEMTGYTGSLRYMAPEVVQRRPYSEKADVYSFGILLWQLAKDRTPFKGLGRDEFVQRVVIGGERPKLDKAWPAAFSSLLKACWDHDPMQRPAFNRILLDLAALSQQQGGGAHPPQPPLLPSLLLSAVSGGHHPTSSSSQQQPTAAHTTEGAAAAGSSGQQPPSARRGRRIVGGGGSSVTSSWF
jgi:serine/threonine protein kinase